MAKEIGLWGGLGVGGCVLQGNVESSSICPSPVSPVLHNGQTTIVVKRKKFAFAVCGCSSYWSAHCTMLLNQQSRGAETGSHSLSYML